MASKRLLEVEGNWLEIVVRILLAITFLETEYTEPFRRKIHPDELWLYKNPRTASYIPPILLWPIVVFVPSFCIILSCTMRRYKMDSAQAFLALTLTLGINGVITNIMKLIVGRPRPDFFWRCFPDGHANENMNCTGNIQDVIEGYKSFPSGHSSFAFASMGFTALYLAGKLHCFNPRGRGQSWRLCLSLLPLVIALMIALSRTVDYHHHWQDILAGSSLGLGIAYLCYYQYYPALDSPYSDTSLAALTHQVPMPHTNADKQSEENLVSVKWI